MGRKTETDEQKVKKVYPDAELFTWDWYHEKGNEYRIIRVNSEQILSIDCICSSAAWSDALRQINAAKRKKYYKRKITRPNGEKKIKATIMLYPSDRTAVIAQYGSVQKFINTIVEQLIKSK